MATSIHFEVLYGGTSEGPFCSILRVDDFTILLDCGWDDEYDVELLRPVEKVRRFSRQDTFSVASLSW